MILGLWKDIPGDVVVHLRVVQCRKRRASPGLGNHQVMPVMLDPTGKTQQKQGSGCSFRKKVTNNAPIEQGFYYQALSTCSCHPSASPSTTHTLPTPGLIVQPGPHCISSQAVRPGRSSGGDAPSSPNSEGLLATRTIKM